MSGSLLSRFQALLGQSSDSQSAYDTPGSKGWVVTLCILAACVLWFAFSMQETYVQVLEFPIEVQNLSDDEALAVKPPESVRVQLEGEGIQILRLYYNPPSLPVDANVARVDLGLTAPEIVKNVSIQSVTPRQVDVAVEERIQKRVPVDLRISLAFAPGFRQIGPITASPDSVTVSGARSRIESIDSWPTETRNLGEMRSNLDAPVALIDSLVGLVDVDLTEVTVRADIEAFTEARRTVEVRVAGLPPETEVTFDPPVVTVIYQVPITEYDAVMEATEFFALVPYDDIIRDTLGRVFPMLRLPEGFNVRNPRFEPEALTYYVVREDD